MDSHDNAWSFPAQRLQVRLEPDQQKLVNTNRIERVQRFTDHWQTRPMYTAVQPHSGGVAWKEQSSPSLNSPDPDGNPFNSEDEEDPELARKKRELQELHEQIMHKKTTIAIKTIEMIVKNPDSPDDQEFDTYNPESLRDRVTEILQQRSFSFFSKVKLCKQKVKAAASRKDEVKQQHHPLKLRVKALNAHRLRDRGILPPSREKILDVPPPLTTRAVASPAKEESNAAKGFERFLNVLNRGADLNLKSMLSDDPLPPPDHIITSPAKQQQEETTTNKGYEHLLTALKTVAAAVPNMKKTGPDVPLLPPGCSITSPERQERTTSKGYERLLSVLNKGAAPNLNTTIPDVSLNPPSHSDPQRTKKENSTKKSPEGESRASRGSEHTGQHSESKSSASTKFESKSKADRCSDHEKSENKHSDHEKSVNKHSDRKTSPKGGNEGQTGDSRASEPKKSVDRGSDLESTISRCSEVKKRNSDCKDGADRGSENANNLDRPSERKTSVHRVYERESSANQGSEIENILDRSSETKRSVSKGSVDRLLEDKGSLTRNFESDSGANTSAGHKNSGDQVSSQSESGVSKTLKSENEKNRGLKSSDNKGFERFVSLLNSGVDITKLSKMIKDEVDDLPKTSPSGLKKAPKSENQKSDTGFSLQGCSGISSVKSKTVNQETSSPEDVEIKKVKKRSSLDSSSQPEPALEVKKKKEEEKGTSEIDEKQKQVQSILKTLGLNLDVEELTKLTDRTQERLYGRKNEGRETSESRMEQKSQLALSHKKHSRSRSSSSSSSSSLYSSSSSSSSTFSRYASRSRSRSPRGRRHRRSRSRDAHRRSRDRGRDGGKGHSRTEANKDAQRPSYRNQQHPFCSPYGTPSAYADYNFYQYAQYMNYYNAYNSAINSNWVFDPNQSHVPPSRSQWHSVLADMKLPNQPGQISLHDFMLFMNPDLSGSEGQSNEPSGSRCLTVINTLPSSASSATECRRLTNLERNELGLKRKNHIKNKRKQSARSTKDFTPKRIIEKSTEKKPAETLTAEKKASETVSMEKKTPETVAMKEKIAETVVMEKKVAETVAMDIRVAGKKTINSKTLNSTPSQGKTSGAITKAMEEKKRRLTEEKIKTNLREKLLEFNRKARLLTQPTTTIKPSANSLDSELL
ncbi:E3 ubiquitin-protein ligase RBBP6-like isoform X1 [Xiphophorus maculatus]|uniref:E3 ubiquitin-protein ligase RBBP6-like isoform X1 n=1 Tax=Xiphophorus maculatus TaxID=8083 RepID=UPI000C6C9F0F|nr:E3 ubiquitin-protein ligase RBBP6-like isoform X1 [Xiphophorus maculatus]XP_023189390.1 E3 ubiquitin-protein ligase RBBP6-like isoform X1 [Xiphophorus maculatus]XP_023189392.1 E3 ubiquitin-protein ligase RBBP6-like isoform X1 [Xiphophorus maculatus]